MALLALLLLPLAAAGAADAEKGREGEGKRTTVPRRGPECCRGGGGRAVWWQEQLAVAWRSALTFPLSFSSRYEMDSPSLSGTLRVAAG